MFLEYRCPHRILGINDVINLKNRRQQNINILTCVREPSSNFIRNRAEVTKWPMNALWKWRKQTFGQWTISYLIRLIWRWAMHCYKVCKLVTNCTKTDFPWNWTEQCHVLPVLSYSLHAFRNSKKILKTSSSMSTPLVTWSLSLMKVTMRMQPLILRNNWLYSENDGLLFASGQNRGKKFIGNNREIW